jgi:hypothetical protein
MATIGRYEIQKEIGRGAMGVVYLARDPQLQRPVALKTYSLPDGISADLAVEFRQRFLREARAAASLSHPGIVAVFDAGEDPSLQVPFIAMEYVPGQSLKQRLETREPLDPSWVLGFGAVLAEALHVAHQAGIVHRDIKPANILIREGDGAAKLADFGVARLGSSDLTRSGQAVGSPGYMSPEQVRGAALDGRSDLFSLAVVLYEALCGRRPFHGDDLISLAYSIAHDTQIPLSKQLTGCPAGLDDFFDRALDKNPDRRFADAVSFRHAFLASGGPQGSARIERTILGASPAPAALLDDSAPVLQLADCAAAVPALPARRRSRALPIAAATLLGVGLAAAGLMRFGPLTAVTPPPLSKESPAQRVAAPPSPRPPAPSVKPRGIPATLPAGTELHASMNAAVGSASSRVGDRITAHLAQPLMSGDRVAIPAGSTLHGRVTSVAPAKKGLSDKSGSLTLAFDRMVTPGGNTVPMAATLTVTAPKSTKKTAGVIGGSAAGGALLGKVLGGDTRDAAVGAVAGAAVGTGIAASTKGNDVSYPAGSSILLRLDRSLTVTLRP